MSRKLLIKACCGHKLELHTMHVLRCGKTCPTTTAPTFGVLAVFYTKWSHNNLLSVRLLWKVFIRKSYRVNTILSLLHTLKNSHTFCQCVYKSGLANALTATKSWKTLVYAATIHTSCKPSKHAKKCKKRFYPRLGVLATSIWLPTECQQLTTRKQRWIKSRLNHPLPLLWHNWKLLLMWQWKMKCVSHQHHAKDPQR